MCYDETLDGKDQGRTKIKSYYSVSNRYSEKSATLLPSIAEKEP